MIQCQKCQEGKEEIFFPKRAKSENGYDGRCKKCHSDCHFENREKRLSAQKIFIKNNKSKIAAQKLKYSNSHKSEKTAYDRIYRDKNKDKIKAYKYKWEKIQLQTNPIFKIKRNMRRRLLHVLNGNLKADKTFNLVGCSAEFLKEYLQSKFTNGMSWGNYGKWHIDHIQPCCSFNLSIPEEQRKCFHYTNLQPLWAIDNLIKSKIV